MMIKKIKMIQQINKMMMKFLMNNTLIKKIKVMIKIKIKIKI